MDVVGLVGLAERRPAAVFLVHAVAEGFDERQNAHFVHLEPELGHVRGRHHGCEQRIGVLLKPRLHRVFAVQTLVRRTFRRRAHDGRQEPLEGIEELTLADLLAADEVEAPGVDVFGRRFRAVVQLETEFAREREEHAMVRVHELPTAFDQLLTEEPGRGVHAPAQALGSFEQPYVDACLCETQRGVKTRGATAHDGDVEARLRHTPVECSGGVRWLDCARRAGSGSQGGRRSQKRAPAQEMTRLELEELIHGCAVMHGRSTAEQLNQRAGEGRSHGEWQPSTARFRSLEPYSPFKSNCSMWYSLCAASLMRRW